ncbi:hypothetical protein SLE2022_025650 [Rubroshorea leprosula]
MHIEEGCEDQGSLDAKRALVGAAARALFYPTLVYNVVRNRIQPEFRWWDRVDEFVLLGAVPFPAHVPCLKELGVSGVVTLNEPYETLVPSSLYQAYGIQNLVIPTRDYLFAPSFSDISQAVCFIHENASLGKTTYVHCKAGRGRSTTIVLCYLVGHHDMTPDDAYDYVRSIRPRVLLAPSQRKAVEEYYLCKLNKIRRPGNGSPCCRIVKKPLLLPAKTDAAVFDDSSVVFVTESDLDGYDATPDSSVAGNKIAAVGGLACRFQVASQAAIARLSCLSLRCQADQKASVKTGQLQSVSVDIRAY